MNPDEVIFFSRSALLLAYYVSMPIIIFTTIAGLLVAILQTIFQVQEQTLSFSVKLSTVVFILFVTGDVTVVRMQEFFQRILMHIVSL
ncbi:EscS/YscS/HrcS family type III secretion system export apparatus protein [Brucella anthropi]|uniref:EscS/YscS/HrcS family type III secretion system export apparatus protein n=1 Tax=Brucella anthropi TaxID=529 RepID=UPI00385106D2